MMQKNDSEMLAALNHFTRRAHTLEEVYLFDLILCDNEIDRDGDCFSEQALKAMQKLFVGVTGIFDHNLKSGNQTARIFRTEVLTDASRRTKTGQPYQYLKANAYMVRTNANADLIREIDAGIKKEVSISCAASEQICSICGTNRLKQHCGHIKGRSYQGALCYTTLDGISDAYEWSFVAVPAQKYAGVTKTLGGSTAAQPETKMLELALEAASGTLDKLTDALRKDVIRLCYRGGETACAKALADSTIHMDAEALLKLRQSLLIGAQAQSEREAAAAKANSQLYPQKNAAAASEPLPAMDEFRMHRKKEGDAR